MATDDDNVLQWHTQAGSMVSEAQIAATSNITYNASTVNFNPAVQFDGTSAQRLRGESATAFSGASTILVVAKDSGTGTDVLGVFASANNPAANNGGQGIYARQHGKYVMDGVGAWDPNSANTTTPSADLYRIVTGNYANTGTTEGTKIFLDGGLEEHYTSPGVGLDAGATFEIGGRTWGTSFENRIFTGEIAEVIYYFGQLTPVEQNKVETYLAIKYGITLLDASGGLNYTLSNDTTVWDATTNAAYHNDVAGIAIDSGSILTQTKSHSINNDSLVTIAEGSTALTDGQAFVWGNNNDTTSFDITAGSYIHMARIWKVDETGLVSSVNVSIPDTIQATYILVDNDTDFSDATEYALTDDGNGSLTATINFSDLQYFTLAVDSPPTSFPGGVSTGLELWLKANEGVELDNTKVITWTDYSGSNNDGIQNNASWQPDYVTETFNFNPAVDFAAAENFAIDDIDMTTDSSGTIFTAFKDYTSHIVGLSHNRGGSESGDAEDPQLWATSQLSAYSDTPTGNQSVTNPVPLVSGAPHIGSVAWTNMPTGDTALAVNGYVVTSTIEIHPGKDVGISTDFWNNPGQGQIGEIIIYNEALSAAETNKVDPIWHLNMALPSPAPKASAIPSPTIQLFGMPTPTPPTTTMWPVSALTAVVC